ncbi:sigma-70 family RNA polymerase sigma factor [Rhodovulum sp. 12E13]|uniref:sigma-70 family RNA polymerase sigma factor n=1 Tax=Rhodovulum sp. 12E13 TaxID=2203891 RepID=UPI000E194948|nr:sigma-70 family RNA polymerase sigma factor [Rhodovulum sp. 12E13]RDC67729.1 sigma-70 family RNA polymerase sigma factor [Rhodovulum sp. 12E13]
MADGSRVEVSRTDRQDALARAWKERGDAAAFEELCLDFQGMVVKNAAAVARWSGMDLEDLKGAAWEAVVAAVDGWSPERGQAVLSHVSRRVRFDVMRYANFQGCAFTVPRSRREERMRNRLPALLAKYEALGWGETTAADLAARDLGDDPAVVHEMLSTRRPCRSIGQTVDDEETGADPVSSAPSAEEEILPAQRARIVRDLLNGLTPLQRRLVSEKVMSKGQGPSLDSLAEETGIGRGRLSRELRDALSQMRAALADRGLELGDLVNDE